MAPYRRASAAKVLKNNPRTRRSAVLILFYPRQKQFYTVLMRRPDYNGVHSAQISFPGGRQELSDKDLSQTALREAKEEVGVNTGKVVLLGSLSEIYIPPSNNLVTPFIGYSEIPQHFVPDPAEVDEIIEVPLAMLLDEALVKETVIPVMGGAWRIKAPYFDVYGNVVWGATAMIISELREICTDWGATS